jgi:hypothetical protein
MFITAAQLVEAYSLVDCAVEMQDEEQVSFQHRTDDIRIFHATMVGEGFDIGLVLEDVARAAGDEFADQMKDAIRSILS